MLCNVGHFGILICAISTWWEMSSPNGHLQWMSDKLVMGSVCVCVINTLA